MLEPGFLPAPLRIARGSRVVNNPSRGSAFIVANLPPPRKGIFGKFLASGGVGEWGSGAIHKNTLARTVKL